MIGLHRTAAAATRRMTANGFFVSRCKAVGGGKKLGDAIAGRRSRRSRPLVRSGHERRRGRARRPDPRRNLAISAPPHQDPAMTDRAKTCSRAGKAMIACRQERQGPTTASWRTNGCHRTLEETPHSGLHSRGTRTAPGSPPRSTPVWSRMADGSRSLIGPTDRRMIGGMARPAHPSGASSWGNGRLFALQDVRGVLTSIGAASRSHADTPTAIPPMMQKI